eukprot:scaffold3121_cov129-Isochrysis_galbana.AAC.3
MAGVRSRQQTGRGSCRDAVNDASCGVCRRWPTNSLTYSEAIRESERLHAIVDHDSEPLPLTP